MIVENFIASRVVDTTIGLRVAWNTGPTLGADLVGMSMVHETIVTVHAGRPLLACCIVANPAAGLG